MEPQHASPGQPPSVLALNGAALARALASLGEPRYRSRQILRWIYRAGASSYEEMTDLPAATRAHLGTRIPVLSSRVEEVVEAGDRTRRVLVRLADARPVEAVLLREGDRATGCLSTQVGCAVGCPFCASGMAGVERNLGAHEIVEQALHLGRLLGPRGRLTHVVLMGIGEPLLNFESVDRALVLLNAPQGLGIGARRITLSTAAPRGKLARLDRLSVGVQLALSLHAPDDALRSRLVPGSAPVAALVAAARRHRSRTRREVTFEYVLLEGVNASAREARALVELLGGVPCSVNLIAFNPVPGTRFRPPANGAVLSFRRILEQGGLAVTIRKRKGRGIEAACGQLRLQRIHG